MQVVAGDETSRFKAIIVSIGIMALVGILTAIDAMKYSLNQTFASLGANSFEMKAKGYSNRFRRGGVQERIYPPISLLQAQKYKQALGDEAQVGISAFISGATEVKGWVRFCGAKVRGIEAQRNR